MQIESFLRGFERGLEKEAGVFDRLKAAVTGEPRWKGPKGDETPRKLGKGPGKPMSWLGGGPSKGVDMPPDISAKLPKASPSDWMKMVNLRTGKVRP